MPKLIKEISKTIFFIAILWLGIRFYVVQPFLVSGSSMEPTFEDSEYIFVNELTYNFTGPKRGDVVVFKHPSPECAEFVEASYINRKFRQGSCKNFIKRVVGLPGESVEIKNGQVKIYNKDYPSGLTLDESSYITTQLYGNQTVNLKKDEYYVIGDNREPNGSSDSREWGPLTRKFITGKAAVIVLPPNKAGFIKSPKY